MPRAHTGPRHAGLAIGLALLFILAAAHPALGAVSEFALPTGSSEPAGIAPGPDGNLWAVERAASRVVRVTPTGAATEFALPAGREPLDIIAAGGFIWFTERTGDRIGRLDPGAGSDAAVQASVVEFVVPGAGSRPTSIASGAEAVWFTEAGSDEIGRLTFAGTMTEFAVPGAGSAPSGIVSGPDGAFWFTETGSGEVGRITTGGVVTNEFRVPTLEAPAARLDRRRPGRRAVVRRRRARPRAPDHDRGPAGPVSGAVRRWPFRHRRRARRCALADAGTCRQAGAHDHDRGGVRVHPAHVGCRPRRHRRRPRCRPAPPARPVRPSLWWWRSRSCRVAREPGGASGSATRSPVRRTSCCWSSAAVPPRKRSPQGTPDARAYARSPGTAGSEGSARRAAGTSLFCGPPAPAAPRAAACACVYAERAVSWSQPDSNRRPPACKAGALPPELWPRLALDGTGDANGDERRGHRGSGEGSTGRGRGCRWAGRSSGGRRRGA